MYTNYDFEYPEYKQNYIYIYIYIQRTKYANIYKEHNNKKIPYL